MGAAAPAAETENFHLLQMEAKGALSLDCGTDFLTHDFEAPYVKAPTALKVNPAS